MTTENETETSEAETPEGEAPEAETTELAEVEHEESPEAGAGSGDLDAQQLMERLQRVSADYQNYQKRMGREKAKWTQDAQRSLIRDMLPVLDTLDAAIASFESDEAKAKELATYKQGVVLVRDEMMRQLTNHRVTKIQAEPGTPYDIDDHEAIMVQEDPEAEAKTVAFVARAGYR
ncbi:MAG TPA: nucleotide exchange factor GrpE, partial [Planctomycetes bacterium]|nr:nucleotide exchange factor GrpE [Planctomycetota bacterium]